MRHLKGCDACRAHKRDLRRLSARLHALNPSLELPLIAGGGGGTAAILVATGAVSLPARSVIVTVGKPSPPART